MFLLPSLLLVVGLLLLLVGLHEAVQLVPVFTGHVVSGGKKGERKKEGKLIFRILFFKITAVAWLIGNIRIVQLLPIFTEHMVSDINNGRKQVNLILKP